MEIGLFFDNSNTTVSGPYKVVNNLIMGLDKIGVQYVHNAIQEYNGCLQSWVPQYRSLPKNTLMGPNLMVLPSDHTDIWKRYDRFLVNSQWTLDMYKSFDITKDNTINIWSVGIDTDRFNGQGRNIDTDCLIYFKNRDSGELNLVKSELDKRSLSYEIISYGNYSEDTLISLTKKCAFCILLTGTESQGIAYMEILSSDIPCFVINQSVFSYQGFSCAGSSVPYFSKKCGILADGLEFGRFDEFINRLNSYTPREYIIENHSLEIAARNYMKFIL